MNDEFQEIRSGVRALCADFPVNTSVHRCATRLPERFVDALIQAGSSVSSGVLAGAAAG